MGVGDDPVRSDRKAAAMAEADHLVLLPEHDHHHPHHRAPGHRNIVGARGRGLRGQRQQEGQEDQQSVHRCLSMSRETTGLQERGSVRIFDGAGRGLQMMPCFLRSACSSPDTQPKTFQPVADHVLDVEAAAAWTSRRWRWRPRSMASGAGAGPNTAMPSTARRGMADAAGDRFGFGRVLGRDDDRREPAERRHRRLAPRLGLGGVEAGASPLTSAAITGASGSWVWTSTRPGLSPRPARPATCWICWKLRSAARRSPPCEAEVGVDHADQGQVGEVIALGDQLGADDDVDLARSIAATNSAAWPATRWCRR
jgi:hypothetical protein